MTSVINLPHCCPERSGYILFLETMALKTRESRDKSGHHYTQKHASSEPTFRESHSQQSLEEKPSASAPSVCTFSLPGDLRSLFFWNPTSHLSEDSMVLKRIDSGA